MIDNFSPVTRRFIAIAILFFVLLFCINIVILPTLGFIGGQLDSLADTRFERARLEAIQERPLPAPGDPIPADIYIHATSAEVVQNAFLATISELGSNNAVVVEQANIVPADATTPQRVAIDLSVSGPELALASFINDLEAHRPIIRFLSWKIVAADVGQGPARLNARAIAIWSRTR